MIKKYIIIALFLFAWHCIFAQPMSIKIEAKDQALNVVLVQLREQYDFQFSYSDNQLSKYKVTVSKTFRSKDDAIEFLLKDLPFQLKKTGEVYILIPDKKKQKEEKQKAQTNISGQIVEVGTFEPLPFSHILINNHPMVSDVMGGFNYTASADSTFHLRISHLGYYVYDTTLFAGLHQKFTLIPASRNLPEVTVKNNIIEKSTLIGGKTGKMKLNHTISRFIPGQGDNSVFNLLRLMPGIQAAGEQSTDLLIWGSCEGQSQITFDEFTVFGLKNYNDNISTVNPFMVKNIEIYKGGFEAKYGNRVGGLVVITGKNGSLQKPTFSLNINLTTINGMVEIPLFKKSSLMLAYRQTYYNLYNSDDFNIFAPTRLMEKSVGEKTKKTDINFDLNVYPDDYKFKDFNLKYSFNFDNGDQFYISAYRGGDYFSLTAETMLYWQYQGHGGRNRDVNLNITLKDTEENLQNGLSAFYGKNWRNGNTSKFILSHSDFNKTVADELQSNTNNGGAIFNSDQTGLTNQAIENDFRQENTLNFTNGHLLELGWGVYNDRALMSTKNTFRDTLKIDTLSQQQNNRFYAYLQDVLPIGERFELKAGFRFNLINDEQRFYPEPRLSASYRLTENTKLSASWGIYNQFMYKIANVDRDQNYNYFWVTSNNKIPVLHAKHWVAGINYFKNDLTLNFEAYYKTTANLSRRYFESHTINGIVENRYFTKVGDAKIYGIDLYVKKEWGHHAVWASYTLSKSLERLRPINQPTVGVYELAPQDQRHEFKIAGIVKLRNFYFSANYVYGSGLEILRKAFIDETNNVSYNRVDGSVTYEFQPKKFHAEMGLSVLNIFDTQNLKFANYKNFQISSELGSVKVYSNAVPFTPILFLKLVF